MGFPRIFSFAEERALGKALTGFLVKSLPPTLVAERRNVLSANRISRLLEQAYAMARDHKAKRGMGLMGKTLTAKSFKASLEEAGYPADFVTVAVEGLIVELSRRRSPEPSKQ